MCIFTLPVGKQRDRMFFFIYCNKKTSWVLLVGDRYVWKICIFTSGWQVQSFFFYFRSVACEIELFCLFIAIGKKSSLNLAFYRPINMNSPYIYLGFVSIKIFQTYQSVACEIVFFFAYCNEKKKSSKSRMLPTDRNKIYWSVACEMDVFLFIAMSKKKTT